ncbi:MAG: class I SAM-dependent methyltransferase [Chlamydiales bacterium]
MWRTTTLTVLSFCASLIAAVDKPVSYEEAQREVDVFFSKSKDEALFLAPFFSRELDDIAEKIVLDSGCGAGLWGLKMASDGATVYGLSNRKEDGITVLEGDFFALSYQDETFDRILSLNIGSHVPLTMRFLGEEKFSNPSLEEYCRELARVMKVGAKMLLVTPASYDVVFTDGSCDEEAAYRHIQKVLEQVAGEQSHSNIIQQLETLEEVNRATFVQRGEKIVLVTDQKELKSGEQIWRKEPSGVELCYFHNEEEYLVALKRVGLFCKEITRPCFFGKVKYNLFQADLAEGERSLGTGYIEHNPFTIYTVEKQLS